MLKTISDQSNNPIVRPDFIEWLAVCLVVCGKHCLSIGIIYFDILLTGFVLSVLFLKAYDRSYYWFKVQPHLRLSSLFPSLSLSSVVKLLLSHNLLSRYMLLKILANKWTFAVRIDNSELLCANTTIKCCNESEVCREMLYFPVWEQITPGYPLLYLMDSLDHRLSQGLRIT